MTDPRKTDDYLLEDLFATARDEQNAPVSDDLMARILQDANNVQNEAFAPKVVPKPSRKRGLSYWATEIKDALGGWGGLTGLCSAMLVGVYVGGTDLAWVDTLGLTSGLSDKSVEFGLEEAFPNYLDLIEGI